MTEMQPNDGFSMSPIFFTYLFKKKTGNKTDIQTNVQRSHPWDEVPVTLVPCTTKQLSTQTYSEAGVFLCQFNARC